MRDRKEIVKEFDIYYYLESGAIKRISIDRSNLLLILEVLLDIRDLLNKDTEKK